MNETVTPWGGPLMAVEWVASVGDDDQNALVAGCGLLVGHAVPGEELPPMVMHLCDPTGTPWISPYAMTPEVEASVDGPMRWWHTPPRLVPLDPGMDVVRALTLRVASLLAGIEEAGE